MLRSHPIRARLRRVAPIIIRCAPGRNFSSAAGSSAAIRINGRAVRWLAATSLVGALGSWWLFTHRDDAIIKQALDISRGEEPLQDKLKKLVLGYAGSCALLSLYDPATSMLHVACTGDSKAATRGRCWGGSDETGRGR